MDRTETRVLQVVEIAKRYNSLDYPIVNRNSDVSAGWPLVYELLKQLRSPDEVKKVLEPHRTGLNEVAKIVLDELVERGIKEYQESLLQM